MTAETVNNVHFFPGYGGIFALLDGVGQSLGHEAERPAVRHLLAGRVTHRFGQLRDKFGTSWMVIRSKVIS